MEGERNYYTEQCLLCTLCRTRGENEITVYMLLCLFLMFPHSIETSTPKH